MKRGRFCHPADGVVGVGVETGVGPGVGVGPCGPAGLAVGVAPGAGVAAGSVVYTMKSIVATICGSLGSVPGSLDGGSHRMRTVPVPGPSNLTEK